jgi:sterol desaturase/sphingolipid hydroxylase (fatty acid hydroxylase superfamily)
VVPLVRIEPRALGDAEMVMSRDEAVAALPVVVLAAGAPRDLRVGAAPPQPAAVIATTRPAIPTVAPGRQEMNRDTAYRLPRSCAMPGPPHVVALTSLCHRLYGRGPETVHPNPTNPRRMRRRANRFPAPPVPLGGDESPEVPLAVLATLVRSGLRAPVDGARHSGVTRRKASLASRLYLPACSIAALALVLTTIGWATRFGGSDFGASLSGLHAVLIGPATLVVLAVFLVAERVRPAQRRSLVARGHRQDVLFTILNASLVAPFVTALSLSFSEVARRIFPWIVLPRAGMVPRWAAIGLIFVAMDGCNWFAHLANHRVRMLWRFHELHHSQEDMNVLTVFRTHPLIHVSYLIALVPGTVLLANGALSTTLLVVYAGMVAFAHSNTNLGFGPLGRLVVSPNYHRIHHRLEGRQDVNLGFALTIWDQLFGRAIFPTPETIRAATGLPGRPLMVEQEGERPRHLAVLLAQLAAPFRPLTDTADERQPVAGPG